MAYTSVAHSCIPLKFEYFLYNTRMGMTLSNCVILELTPFVEGKHRLLASLNSNQQAIKNHNRA